MSGESRRPFAPSGACPEVAIKVAVAVEAVEVEIVKVEAVEVEAVKLVMSQVEGLRSL